MSNRQEKHRDQFNGKVVWITGASSGIGEQLCYELDELGAYLILSARNSQKLEKVKGNLRYGKEHARILPLDLEQLETIPDKARTAMAYFGKIDYLIHNAAVAIRDFALSTKLDVDKKLMNINYFGPVALTKEVMPQMLERDSGHVVAISSLTGKFGVPRTAAYAASKHAMHGFFDSLRTEITSPNIFVSVLVPGIIRTAITTNAVNGDGSNFGKYERINKEGFPVDKACQQMVRAIVKRKEEKFIGGYDGMTLTVNRLAPGLFRKIIRNHPVKRIRKFKMRLSSLVRYFSFNKELTPQAAGI